MPYSASQELSDLVHDLLNKFCTINENDIRIDTAGRQFILQKGSPVYLPSAYDVTEEFKALHQ